MMAWYSRERSSFNSSARRSRETSVSAAPDFGSGIFFLLLRKTGIHNRKEILSYYHGTYHPDGFQRRRSGRSPGLNHAFPQFFQRIKRPAPDDSVAAQGQKRRTQHGVNKKRAADRMQDEVVGRDIRFGGHAHVN